MTRFIPPRFRRSLVTLGVLAGAGGLALGLAGSATAATTGGYPSPSASPSPTVLYTPPPQHHNHHPRPVVHCFLSLETEHDTLTGQPVGDQGSTYDQGTYGQQFGQQGSDKPEATIEVVQLVKVCVTEQRGRPDRVQVWDETGPFAFEVPASGIEPTPHGLPSSIAGMLTTP
jgi:hypothetical protein